MENIRVTYLIVEHKVEARHSSLLAVSTEIVFVWAMTRVKQQETRKMQTGYL